MVEAAEPSTIEINTAPAFASVAVNNTANRAPTAKAGPDQSVASKKATVSLNGFESSDGSEESFALKYNWTQISGPSVTLTGATTPGATFAAPTGPATLEFKLEVCDNDATPLCNSDNVVVTVKSPPTANAGADQTVESGTNPVTLDGSGSSDPNGETLTYKWSQTAGPSVTLSSTTVQKPTFTAPTGPATLEFKLEVCESVQKTSCSTDTVVIHVRQPNVAPVANAGTDQTVASEATVTLDGSGSTDANTEAPLNTLSYEWSQLSGTAVTLSSTTAQKPTFTAPTGPATLEFELKVCDGGSPSLCSTDKVKVTVTAANEAPTANAGPDQTVASEATVTLDGSGSTDPNNDPLSYEWSQLSGPAVTLEGASTAKPTFKAPKGPATLEFELKVCDPAPLCNTDSVTVTVKSPPTANAGPDQTVESGTNPVTLDGSGSSDPNGETITYKWSQISGTAVTLSSTTAQKPTFAAPTGPATLEFSLEVCESIATTSCATDTVVIHVRQPNVAPVANAGPDQSVASEATVTLDGSGSTDANTEAPLNTLSYEWSQLSGTAVTLSSATAQKPTFTAPTGPATLEFELKVCDGGSPSLCSTDKVTVTVTAGNEAPVANAGPDQKSPPKRRWTLDGSGSTDPNNDPLTYEWSQLSGPAVTLEGASTAKPTFKAPAGPATLEFELEVCDPAPLCSTDTVTVTVKKRETKRRWQTPAPTRSRLRSDGGTRRQRLDRPQQRPADLRMEPAQRPRGDPRRRQHGETDLQSAGWAGDAGIRTGSL